jgi:radical SAM superfamily enzyme YgiQ (UPF0313 family)
MKIALMAMSGIRVCDTELLELGLTLPGFVERSKTIASLPSLGLLTLAGMTPKHHELSYIEVPDLTAVDPLPTNFDLVAISSYSAQINEAYDLADQYKKMGIPVVIGGPHVSILPNEAIDHCDAVVIGEGESVWIDVLNDCESGKLKSIYGSLNGKYSLNDAPTPAFELLDISKYNRLTVQTSRGCPHRCEFCASSILLVDEYKQKPMHKVLTEIDKIINIWKNPYIEFADDNTFVNKEYWKELLTQLKERKIKWFTETDLSVSQDEQLLELMRESGCAQVLIGFESPNQAALKGVDLRNDWKYNHFAKYKEAIQKIQSHGVTVNGCFVIGLDGHDETIFDQVFEFVKEKELYEVQVTILTPFPGTPLYERLKGQNRLLEPEAWTKCTLFDLNFEPLKMSQEALAGGFKTLVNKLYDDDFTRWRRDNFKKYLRENHVIIGD